MDFLDNTKKFVENHGNIMITSKRGTECLKEDLKKVNEFLKKQDAGTRLGLKIIRVDSVLKNISNLITSYEKQRDKIKEVTKDNIEKIINESSELLKELKKVRDETYGKIDKFKLGKYLDKQTREDIDNIFNVSEKNIGVNKSIFGVCTDEEREGFAEKVKKIFITGEKR